MLKVEMYQTVDGSLFQTEEQAIAHENKIKVENALTYLVDCDSVVSAFDSYDKKSLVTFLIRERRRIMEILGGK